MSTDLDNVDRAAKRERMLLSSSLLFVPVMVFTLMVGSGVAVAVALNFEQQLGDLGVGLVLVGVPLLLMAPMMIFGFWRGRSRLNVHRDALSTLLGPEAGAATRRLRLPMLASLAGTVAVGFGAALLPVWDRLPQGLGDVLFWTAMWAVMVGIYLVLTPLFFWGAAQRGQRTRAFRMVPRAAFILLSWPVIGIQDAVRESTWVRGSSLHSLIDLFASFMTPAAILVFIGLAAVPGLIAGRNLARGDWDRALWWARNRPSFVGPLFALRARLGRGEAADAAAFAETELRLLSLSPAWQMVNGLGDARFAVGDYPGAVAAYRAALEMNPNDAASWAGVAQVACAMGTVDADTLDTVERSLEHHGRLLPRQPGRRRAEALATRGWVLALLGRDPDARAQLAEAREVAAQSSTPVLVRQRAEMLLARAAGG